MGRNSIKHIATILLMCYSLVVVHSILPHSHEGPSDIFHKHENTHGHSLLGEIFHLIKHITYYDLGKGHLEEYLATPKTLSKEDADSPCESIVLRTFDYSNQYELKSKTPSDDLYRKAQHSPFLYRRGPPAQA